MGNNYCPIIHNKLPQKITWNLQSVNLHDILGPGYQKIIVNEYVSRNKTSVHSHYNVYLFLLLPLQQRKQ